MEAVSAVLLAALIGLLVGRVGGPLFQSIDRAISQLVGGFRGDGWPRGIQEEDRDKPWGKPAVVAAPKRQVALPPMPAPVLTKVKPTVHTR